MNRNSNNPIIKNYPFQDNSILQQRVDFSYKNNTLVHNLNDNLLKENINEYRLNIDSYDRDQTIFRDPFTFNITLAPLATRVKQQPVKELIPLYSTNPKYIIDENELVINKNKGSLTKDFKNIKFIRLDALIMPRYNTFILNTEWDLTVTKDRFVIDNDPAKSLFNDRYVQLQIKELKENNNYSTNVITDNSFIVIPDKQWGELYYKGLPYYAIKLYQDSALGNLNKLTFDFYNSFGEKITINTNAIDNELNQLAKIILPVNNTLLFDKIISMYNNPPILPFALPPPLIISDIFDAISLLNSNSNLFKDSYDYIINTNGLSSTQKKTITDYINSMNYFDFLTNKFNEIIKYIALLSPAVLLNALPLVLNIVLPYVDLDTDLPLFVDANGKFQTYNNITIDQYLNNVLWWDRDLTNINYITNLQEFYNYYVSDLFVIFHKLKQEYINLPLHKSIQCHIMLVLGIWENELSTRINYGS